MPNLTPAQRRWTLAILTNDETSTDAELIAHLQTEGGISEADARYWVAQRADYLSGVLILLAWLIPCPMTQFAAMLWLTWRLRCA